MEDHIFLLSLRLKQLHWLPPCPLSKSFFSRELRVDCRAERRGVDKDSKKEWPSLLILFNNTKTSQPLLISESCYWSQEEPTIYGLKVEYRLYDT
jgi:hypothetical protein